MLYLPASNARALEKAKTLPCDALILDLEDAVAPGAKVDAREQACGAVASGAYGPRELVIRVNGLDTEWHDAERVLLREYERTIAPDGDLTPCA